MHLLFNTVYSSHSLGKPGCTVCKSKTLKLISRRGRIMENRNIAIYIIIVMQSSKIVKNSELIMF